MVMTGMDVSRRALVILAALVIGSVPWSSGSRAHQDSRGPAPGDHTFSLQHEGRSRSYILHVPAATPNDALPLVLAFHGGGGEAEGFKRYAGLDAVADREKFIVAYPDGSGPLARRLLTWNAGECCGYAMKQRVDDVGFAIAILEDVARRMDIDARRVYATGHSNGAMMAYRLGAERADRITAIAPVAGAYSLRAFNPSRAVAVLHIHSVDDPRALYHGGIGPPFPGTNQRASHRPVMDGLMRWRLHNKCSEETRTLDTRRGSSPADGTSQTATLIAWNGCATGGQVAHWKLTGVGHGWPGTRQTRAREQLIGPPTTLIATADEVWTFFQAVARKPGSAVSLR